MSRERRFFRLPSAKMIAITGRDMTVAVLLSDEDRRAVVLLWSYDDRACQSFAVGLMPMQPPTFACDEQDVP